jgi:hypothetical protein
MRDGAPIVYHWGFFYLLTAEGNIAKSLSKLCFYAFQEINKR